MGAGPGARSSHAIAIVGQKAYVFGGEFSPRVPVDNNLHVFDLETLTWSVANVTGDIPPPRVGVTMTSIEEVVYVFGGRDSTHSELNELYSLTCGRTNGPSFLAAMPAPPIGATTPRPPMTDECTSSVGAVSPEGSTIYGPMMSLTESGFSIQTQEKTARVGVGRASPWPEEKYGRPTGGEKATARSVFCTICIGKYIIIHGVEVDPSDLGHLGAGKFTGEVYGLDTETLEWKKWVDGPGPDNHPGPRGWCAFGKGWRDGQEGLLVYGCNSPTNDRLDDISYFTPLY
ncbi:hypothetical protein SLEP1_g28667 [Rubroshorea leprosula]|uniref:Nitrile-specifier protein 5 n=1 Tax=Rubroshorea leprosula TaxID=152421 RepID=A0AAV5K3V2_9ROSI|nr:hypothetical protein SLEP1_g28667 [Rubroshorea leprosula]